MPVSASLTVVSVVLSSAAASFTKGVSGLDSRPAARAAAGMSLPASAGCACWADLGLVRVV